MGVLISIPMTNLSIAQEINICKKIYDSINRQRTKNTKNFQTLIQVGSCYFTKTAVNFTVLYRRFLTVVFRIDLNLQASYITSSE